MSSRNIGILVAAVTILVNLLLAYFGSIQQIVCTVASNAHTQAAAAAAAF